jgi:putative glycosyl hydrolase-like family 15 (GHL15) protein
LGYPGNYVADVGSSGYQQAWIANVLGYLGQHPGIAGIFIDDVLYDLKPLAGTEAAKYPTRQQWAAAQLSFVEAVGTAFRAQGYYVALNASGYVPGDPDSDTGTNTVAWWEELGPYVDGLMNEYYMETSNGTDQPRASGDAWDQNWDGWQRLVQTAQSMGDDFYGVMYGPADDTGAMTYGKASFLLDWNGGGGAFMYGIGSPSGSDPTSSAWTTDIGKPVEDKEQVGVGWMRTYTGGAALVNPSPTDAQTFQLNGRYVTPSGSTVTSVTLQPASG